MIKRIFVFLIMLSFISCDKSDTETGKTGRTNTKSKEERLLEKQEREKAWKQMFDERKEKYKGMLSEHRESGDVRGVWIIQGNDIKNIKSFLNTEIKHSMYYCIQISDNIQTGKIYFTVTDKVFDIKIEKISETKYKMIYENRERVFDIVKVKRIGKPGEWSMQFFYDDFHKFDPMAKVHTYDGTNFYDICTSGINECECTVEGCLQYIKQLDDISKAESEGPLGIE